MSVVKVGLDRSKEALPSITQSTIDTLNNNSVRCINDNFFCDEEQAISILNFSARVCYKSDNRKTSPLTLIKHLYDRQHFSVFEHVNYSFLLNKFYIEIFKNILFQMGRVDKFLINPIKFTCSIKDYDIITCNLRSLIELFTYSNFISNIQEQSFIHSIIYNVKQDWPNLSQILFDIELEQQISSRSIRPYLYIIPKTIKNKSRRYVFHVVCTRAIANQIVRHRTLSFSQESTRFINLTKNNDNADICIYFSDSTKENVQYITMMESVAKTSMEEYCWGISQQIRPEDARDCLPLGLKTELVVSGTYDPTKPKFLYDGFARFFLLRHNAQPAIAEISNKIARYISKVEKRIGNNA